VPTRNVQFDFAANDSPGDVTDHMVLTIYDPANAVVHASGHLPRTATTYVVQLTTQSNYVARLVAYSAAGTPNPGAAYGQPFQTFSVPDPPPPTPPGNPTIATPILL
jgi:hypothetical protein